VPHDGVELEGGLEPGRVHEEDGETCLDQQSDGQLMVDHALVEDGAPARLADY